MKTCRYTKLISEGKSPMTKLQLEILLESIELMKKYPTDKKVISEQSEIIKRILRDLKVQNEQ